MGVPGRFSRERGEVERFDRALEPSPDHGDGEFADELAVVTALRELGRTGGPDPATRERIRAEIEGRLGEPVARRRWRPRMADLTAVGIALVLGLVGLTLLLSKNAVPGDTLYGVKRAGEATSLAFTFGDEAKAQKHLEFAAGRVAELGRMTTASPAAYRTALDDFGTDVRAGVTQLTGAATGGNDHGQLAGLESWARDQSGLLAAEQSRVPAAATLDLTGARGLLSRVQERTTALVSRLNCYEITTGSSDELGLLPARSTCTQQQPSRIGAPPAPAPSPVSPPPTSSETVPPTTRTSAPSNPDLAVPTAPAPTPAHGTGPPQVFAPPIPTPSAPRLPTPPSPPPPVLSFPPLLPGLPPIVIG